MLALPFLVGMLMLQMTLLAYSQQQNTQAC